MSRRLTNQFSKPKVATIMLPNVAEQTTEANAPVPLDSSPATEPSGGAGVSLSFNGQAALALAGLGYFVFPTSGKIPLTDRGVTDASNDPATIEAWWTKWPDANVAVSTRGLVAVDIDGTDNTWPPDPDQAASLAAGVLSLTASGGRHYIFRRPAGCTFGNSASRLAPNVDIKTDGGYIVVPPSVFQGKPYRWGSDGGLDVPADRLSLLPQWLIDALSDTPRRTEAPQTADEIPSGRRNQTLTSIAGTMRHNGMSYRAMLAALLETNAEQCKPPLDASEVETIARSVSGYEPNPFAKAATFGESEPIPDFEPFPLDCLPEPLRAFVNQQQSQRVAIRVMPRYRR
jgi:hypothetical protein